ncbi:hypothetical protein JYU12_01685 [bacterium AH-315-K03]|nr:hypothetical protein [bacterium AH-315-K03]
MTTTKIFTPDSRASEKAELCTQIQDLAYLLNSNPEAAKLLSDAQAKRISEQEFLMALANL